MDDIVNGIIKVVSMGVSSLDKTESANRTKPKRYPTFSGSDQPNQSKPTLLGLVLGFSF